MVGYANITCVREAL